jgi:hypothetical protein
VTDGEPLSGDEHSAIDEFPAGHERDRLGRVTTPFDMFGLDETDLRDRFAPHVEGYLS